MTGGVRAGAGVCVYTNFLFSRQMVKKVTESATNVQSFCVFAYERLEKTFDERLPNLANFLQFRFGPPLFIDLIIEVHCLAPNFATSLRSARIRNRQVRQLTPNFYGDPITVSNHSEQSFHSVAGYGSQLRQRVLVVTAGSPHD